MQAKLNATCHHQALPWHLNLLQYMRRAAPGSVKGRASNLGVGSCCRKLLLCANWSQQKPLPGRPALRAPQDSNELSKEDTSLRPTATCRGVTLGSLLDQPLLRVTKRKTVPLLTA